MILETPRLYLRPLQETDAYRMSEYRQKVEVAKYQSWKTYSVSTAKKRIQACLTVQDYRKPRTNYHLGIVLKTDDILIGDLFVDVLNKNVFVLGYTLDSTYWSCGYASEMVDAFLHYMHDINHFQKVLCYAYKENERSIHLLKKLGFHKFEESYFYGDVGYSKILE